MPVHFATPADVLRLGRSESRAIVRGAAFSLLSLCAGCEQVSTPPPTLLFDGLPVSGRLIDAQRAGFDDCFNMDAVHMRCRRHDVTIDGQGPYEAAVDLKGSKGQGGFDQLTIWHKRDNYEVYKIVDGLTRRGWKQCYTGTDRWGDQAIYTKEGSPVRVSMDLSYWGKRRVRILPDWNRKERRCTPEESAARQWSITRVG